MKLYRSLELPVFALSRLADLFYERGMLAGRLPCVPHGTALLYAVSTAVMFHVATLEPQNLKQRYWKSLLLPLSGRLFEDLNRRLICNLNSQSACFRPDFWPSYDPRAVPTYMLTDRALTVLGLQS
jgi:hypothetical protein